RDHGSGDLEGEGVFPPDQDWWMIARPTLLSLVVAAACRGDAPPQEPKDNSRTAMPTSASPAAEERLSENAPARISDRKVVVFNLGQREYARADGSHASGPTAVLSVSDGTTPVETVVGQGSRVTIGADTYDVVSVTDSKVVLRLARP